MIPTALVPMHPGEILREEILPAMKIGKAELADRLHISRQTLYNLLNEKQSVTANLALRLGKLFGNTPEFWLGLQQKFDLATQRESLAEELKSIETLAA